MKATNSTVRVHEYIGECVSFGTSFIEFLNSKFSLNCVFRCQFLHKFAVAHPATTISIISIQERFQLAIAHVHLVLMHQSHEVLLC